MFVGEEKPFLQWLKVNEQVSWEVFTTFMGVAGKVNYNQCKNPDIFKEEWVTRPTHFGVAHSQKPSFP